MASAAKDPNPSNKEAPEGANVDKIRDILFGSQMRDYEKRFVRLEDNVTKAIEGLREDMTKRLDTLGAFVRQEVDSLSTRLKSEKSERTEGLKEISREIKDGTKIIEKKLSQLEEQMSDGQSELRAKLLELPEYRALTVIERTIQELSDRPEELWTGPTESSLRWVSGNTKTIVHPPPSRCWSMEWLPGYGCCASGTHHGNSRERWPW